MSNIVAILLDNLQKIDMSVYEFSKQITIHDLTPFHERVEDVPVLIKRKSKQNQAK